MIDDGDGWADGRQARCMGGPMREVTVHVGGPRFGAPIWIEQPMAGESMHIGGPMRLMLVENDRPMENTTDGNG